MCHAAHESTVNYLLALMDKPGLKPLAIRPASLHDLGTEIGSPKGVSAPCSVLEVSASPPQPIAVHCSFLRPISVAIIHIKQLTGQVCLSLFGLTTMYQVFEAIFDIVGTEFALFALALLIYIAFSSKRPSLRSVAASAPRHCSGLDARDARGARGKVPRESAPGQREVKKAKSPHQEARDVVSRATEIRTLGKAHSLEEACALFDGAIASADKFKGARSSSLLFNSVLESCVECGDVRRALQYFEMARAMKCADTVSFNIVIKGYAVAGDEVSAQKLLHELLQSDNSPTVASFHSLLHARVGAGDSHGAWRCIDDMRSVGLEPNGVTCSMLLRGVRSLHNRGDLQRIIGLYTHLTEPADETLMASLVEACLNAKRLDALSKVVGEHRRKSGNVCFSTAMYGSMIKAFGQARDIEQVLALWQDMVVCNVQPSAITFGCMVEALVANHRADDAWEIMQKAWDDEMQRPLLNTVIFSTLLKGFASNSEKTMHIYKVMRERSILCNTITYNTILNTFARSGAVHLIGGLLEDMRAAEPPAEPDLITYSTMIKCFCSNGEVAKALDLYDEMKRVGQHAPDEMLYNSLLDGCAKSQRVNDALRLLDEMRAGGVTPSNYTLTMVVKLLGRCRRLNQAFSKVDEMAKEYGLTLNIHVYTCLIQACFQNKQPLKAISVLDWLEKEGAKADQKTFGALVRGCLQTGQPDRAAEIARRAFAGVNPVGLESKDLEELTRKLGAGSASANSIQAAVTASLQRALSSKSKSHGRPAPAAIKTQPPWHRAKPPCKHDYDSDTGGSTTDPSDGSLSN